MNIIEKIGLFLIIAYFTKDWPEAWRGGEVVFAMAGGWLFFGGKLIQSWINAFREVK